MGPVNWYFDISVLVPAAVTRHPHNAPALSVLEELLRRKHRGFISAHSLTEIYSVLTRTPFKPPLYRNIKKSFTIAPSVFGPEAGFMTPSTYAVRKRPDAIASTRST